MEFWKLAVLFLSCFLGGASIFFIKRQDQTYLKLILSFSGAYLFAITVLHLIPEVYSVKDHNIGLFILAGFLFQVILEQFSHGVEHGHFHTHAHGHSHHTFPIGIMISLCLHAFLEGMPLVQSHQNELLFGIALHHIPAAFALASILLQSAQSKKRILFMLVLFALMSPMGYLLSAGISTSSIGNLQQYFGRIMAVVIGIFLHISTTILFESNVDHHFNRKKLIAILLGTSIALAGFFMHIH